MIHKWQKVWRQGVAPQISDKGLQVLRQALETDDERLLQGATTNPPALQCVEDWDCEGACLLAFPGWQGEELKTVGQVEEYFARLCFETDQALGEPAAICYLLNWFDDTPRAEMRRWMLGEVNLEIEKRECKQTAAT